MAASVSFNARSVHTFAQDRIYRVELRHGLMYFLRIGGQFDLERGRPVPGVPGQQAAVMILAVGEALFRKHKREELIARDPNQEPEALLPIHPHNFKLGPSDVERAVFLPKKWFLSLFRPHYGRLVLDLTDGKRWEFHFEQPEDLRAALASVGGVLGDKLTKKVIWDEEGRRFTKAQE